MKSTKRGQKCMNNSPSKSKALEWIQQVEAENAPDGIDCFQGNVNKLFNLFLYPFPQRTRTALTNAYFLLKKRYCVWVERGVNVQFFINFLGDGSLKHLHLWIARGWKHFQLREKKEVYGFSWTSWILCWPLRGAQQLFVSSRANPCISSSWGFTPGHPNAQGVSNIFQFKWDELRGNWYDQKQWKWLHPLVILLRVMHVRYYHITWIIIITHNYYDKCLLLMRGEEWGFTYNDLLALRE